LHHWHAAHAARFIDRDGWQVVASYSEPKQELEAARTDLGVADISAFAKVSLRGPEVTALAPSLIGESTPLSRRGVALIPAELTLACQLTEDHLLLLASRPMATELDQRLSRLREGRAVVQTDVTSAYAGFAVVGPRLEELLCRLTHLDIRPVSLPLNSCAETALAGVEALLVRSAGLPVPVLRIYVASDLGEYVWERMMQAGHGEQVTPIGLDALGILGVLPGTTDA
jgi:glycine cleavage system aminomethyltransferase T